MRAPPVATVTNPEAPFPPADALPVFVPPPVMVPVSNLDFLPVDDAFALEFRSETIEQLVGGDAMRRGESERIEAGRSHTNADLVAGRDRVRVQGTLHEHTGHGLAEQAAHLHTTVDGTLDVHAGSEDTVLLAGHMRELWDGGAAIVAAMTDDTVAGGGIRVTTPLDLWVHGLMGVEERIGTCTADAVLMESSATHYEREYGPGVHAAGLAVYTGSLYQSSRSSFRPLIRVSSGVRNLIAAGGGEGDGGGSAPAASSPPTPAAGGAGTQTASRTLCAATGAGADQTPQAGVMAGVRSEDLTGIHRGDDVAAPARGTNVTRASGDLTGLHRGTDTAGQLRALHDAMRGTEAGAQGEEGGVFRFSKHDDTGSVQEACGPDVVADIRPGATVPGMDAPVLPSTVSPPQPPPGVKFGLLGGADRPPQSAAPVADFPAAHRRLRELRDYYHGQSKMDIYSDFRTALKLIAEQISRKFDKLGASKAELKGRPSDIAAADQAYRILRNMADQAANEGNLLRAAEIRQALFASDEFAIGKLQALCKKHLIAEAPTTQAMLRPSATAGPTVTVAAIPPPAATITHVDWITAYRQLRDLDRGFSVIGLHRVHLDFREAADAVVHSIMRKFTQFGGKLEDLQLQSRIATTPEQAYRAMQGMVRQALESGNAAQADEIFQALDFIHESTAEKLDMLARRYGALDALSTQVIEAIEAKQLLSPRVGPTTSAALPVTVRPPATIPSMTVPPPGQLGIPVLERRIDPEIDPTFSELAGELVHATGVPGPPPASGLPGPSLFETAGAQAGDLGRARLDPPATVSGTTAAEPVAIETAVTPSLAGTSSFWLQPANPMLALGSVPVDSDLHRAGETVQPPLVTAASGSTAPALSPGAAFLTPSWADDNLLVERLLLAGRSPPKFDAAPFVADIDMYTAFGLAEFGLAEELTAGRLPFQAIDALIAAYRETDAGGGNTAYIEYLLSLKESISRALLDAYPERADPQWLIQVRGWLGLSGEPVAPSAASATDWSMLEGSGIIQLLGTGEGASHPAPLPPPSAAGRAGEGVGAPPPAADPWGIRPPGMGGEPHPVAFDPSSAPPDPGSQVVYTETMRPPPLSTGAPPEWQGAGTPGFDRAASGAVDLPFSHREANARRFGTEDALPGTALTPRTGGTDTFGWSDTRPPDLFADPDLLNAVIQSAAAGRGGVDWHAIEVLERFLDIPSPSP